MHLSTKEPSPHGWMLLFKLSHPNMFFKNKLKLVAIFKVFLLYTALLKKYIYFYILNFVGFLVW